MNNNLLPFHRLLPKGGVTVYPKVKYVDCYDIPLDTRLKAREFLHEDTEYKKLREYRGGIDKGQKAGRMYCVYVLRLEEYVGFMTMTEMLDNPDGYGEGDFCFSKFIYPKFRHTKYSRYAASDLFHMVFKSNVAKNLYSYFLVSPQTTGDSFYSRVDMTVPCLGIVYPTDGPDVQKYMKIKKEFSVRDRKVMLVEINGDIYRGMDLRTYFLTAPGRTEEVVDRWLKEMDLAAEKVLK